MIEKKIEDLIDAIDRNTAALLGVGKGEKLIAAKPVAAKKPVKSEEQVVAEIAAKSAVQEAETTATEESGVTLESVKAALDSLLKANKRKEAIALLASFEKATNVTSIVAQGAEVMAAFIQEANGILLTA
jgi:hypothetical protein